MKKLFCLLLCSVMIFSSVSLCFATPVDWDSSDSQHLTEIRNAFVSGGTIYNMINAINSNVVNLNSNLITLMRWLDPSSGGGSTALLNQILNALTYTDAAGAIKSFIADIYTDQYGIYLSNNDLKDALANFTGSWNNSAAVKNAHSWLTDQNGNYSLVAINGQGTYHSTSVPWNIGSPLGNLGLMLHVINDNIVNDYMFRWNADLTGYNSQQTGLSWTDIEQSITFTPTSSSIGIYNWLQNIQAPVARLSYVLASDERIAAQEAAAANEEAVVDNFIDSSGDGAASPSDIGSVSDLSSGYKQNFGTDASPSGIFEIFNSDHATWFSQETMNQLDTTTPTRLTKGSESDTPLLDKQIDDIYDALGVKQP